MSAPERPFVSVIVPVYDDPRLSLCLEALAGQTYPADRFQVLVVDNGSERSVAPLLDPFPEARLLCEPGRGAYAARNHGVRAAEGQVLAFTDADCVPDPRWLEAGVDRLVDDPAADMVGGDVVMVPRDPSRLTSAEVWECAWGFPQQEFVEEKHFAATANLFVGAADFAAVGPFADHMMSSGDVEWGQRARRVGKRMVFSAEARVFHPTRSDLGELIGKYLRTCGGKYQLREQEGTGHLEWALRIARRPLESATRSDLDLTPVDRMRYAGVEALLSASQLLELARLSLGGTPRRR